MDPELQIHTILPTEESKIRSVFFSLNITPHSRYFQKENKISPHLELFQMFFDILKCTNVKFKIF